MGDLFSDIIKDVVPLSSRRELVSKWFETQRELQKAICPAVRAGGDGNWQLVISSEDNSELFELLQSQRKIKDFYDFVPLEYNETSITLDAANYAMLSSFIDQEIAWHNTVIASIAVENQGELSCSIKTCGNWVFVLIIIYVVPKVLYMLYNALV